MQLKSEMNTIQEQFVSLLNDFDRHCNKTQQMVQKSQQLKMQNSWRARFAYKRRQLERTRLQLANLDLNIKQQQERMKQNKIDVCPCSCSKKYENISPKLSQEMNDLNVFSEPKQDYNHNYRTERKTKSCRKQLLAPSNLEPSINSSMKVELSPRLATIPEDSVDRWEFTKGPKTSSPLYENVDLYEMRDNYKLPRSRDTLFDITQSTILSEMPTDQSMNSMNSYQQPNVTLNDKSDLKLHTTPVHINHLSSPTHSPENIHPLNIMSSTALDLPSPKSSNIKYASSHLITQMYSSPRSPSPQRLYNTMNSSISNVTSPAQPVEQKTWAYRRNRRSSLSKHCLPLKRINHDLDKSDEGCVSDTETVLSDMSVLTWTILEPEQKENAPDVSNQQEKSGNSLHPQMDYDFLSKLTNSSHSTSGSDSNNKYLTPVNNVSNMATGGQSVNSENFHRVVPMNSVEKMDSQLEDSLVLFNSDIDEPHANFTETELDEGNCSYKSETSSVCTESHGVERSGGQHARQYAYVNGQMKVLKRQTGQSELENLKPMIGLSETDLIDPMDSRLIDNDWNSPSSKYSSLDATRTSIPNLDEVVTSPNVSGGSCSDNSPYDIYALSGKSLDSSLKESDGIRSSHSVASVSPPVAGNNNNNKNSVESPQSSNDSGGLVAPVNSPNITDSSSSRPTTDTYDYSEIQNFDTSKSTSSQSKKKTTPGRCYGYTGRTPPTCIKRSQYRTVGRYSSPGVVKTVTKTKTVTYSIPTPDTPTGPRETSSNPRRSLLLHHDRDSGFSTQGSNMSKHFIINDAGVMRTVVQHSAVARNLQHQRKKMLKKRLKQFSNNFYNGSSTGNLQIQTLAHF